MSQDRSGMVVLHSDGWPVEPGGLLTHVRFETPLERAPAVIVLTPENAAAQALDYRRGGYASQATAMGFGVYGGVDGVRRDTLYLWRYVAIGAAA